MGDNNENPSGPPTYREAEEALEKLRKLQQSRYKGLEAARKLIHVLIDRDRRVVLYLGAGCNMDVDETPTAGAEALRSKTWLPLLESLFNELDESVQAEFLQDYARRAGKVWKPRRRFGFKHLLRGGEMDKLQLAWLLTNYYGGREARDKTIAKLVEPKGSASSKSELYDAVLALPFDDIVTTNYDGYIPHFLKARHEKAWAQQAKKDRGVGEPPRIFEEIIDVQSLAKASKAVGVPRIFYLHGRAGVSDRLVFDRFDYAELLTERDGMLDYVTFLLRDSHVIYVGSGLDDLTFNQMETRLHALHPAGRPPSFAFLPIVTEEEREKWRERDLEIIDYSDRPDRHAHLPEILKCINTVRCFVNSAEPDRPNREEQRLDANRTKIYWAQTLKLYVKGDFEGSLQKGRAALASTLFWKRTPMDARGGERLLPFDRAAMLCDIRIRMALSHYKLRWGRKGQHDDLMRVNIEAADELIKGQKKRSARGAKGASNQRTLLALWNSLEILRMRNSYHQGKFQEARSRYEKVVKSVRSDDIEVSPRDTKTEVITKLRLAEGLYYAKCQLSRLEYQFIDRSTSGRRRGRRRQVRAMLAVEKETGRLCEFLMTKEKTCQRYPEWEYFLNSLSIIRRISKWTAGRHAVRVCQDLIPTRKERTSATYRELGTALSYLAGKDNEGDEGETRSQPVGQPRFWKQSPHWPVLRYRYQCRGYALRWLVGQELNRRECDADIIRAFQAIQLAFNRTRGRGLERQQVVNLLEAARLNILAMFGEKKRRGRHGQIRIASPLTIGAGIHYLDRAFTELESKETANKWLLALAYRLASYLALVAGPGLQQEVGAAKSAQMKKFLEKNPDDMAGEVAEQYRQFAIQLGDEHAFDQRVEYYTATFDAIRGELRSM